MENSIQPQEEQFEKVELFDTPEQLAASMAQESQPEVEAQPEPAQETPYVDPEAAPAEPTTLEQITESAEPPAEPQPEAQQEEEG